MKNFKRILVLVLAVVLAVGTALSISAATTFTDTDNHWAWKDGYIPYLVEKNVLNGYPKSDGTYYFKPDGEVTRAEFIKMLDETFGLTAVKAINYSDVKSNDWFYVYFQKAAAQGYILNYGSTVNPNGKITREEAISLLVRYLKLDETKVAPASTFADFNTISSQYQTYVLEAIYAGLTDGYKQSNGTYLFKPANTLTRAEALTILYRAAGAIFNKNSYVRDAGAADTNSVITKSGVSVQDQTLTGRTIVSEGVTGGIVTFSNCTIKDTLYVRGNTKVYLDKCVVENVVVDGQGSVSLSTGTTIADLTLNQKTAITAVKGTSIDNLTVNPAATGSTVSGDGAIKKAAIKAQGFNSSVVPAEYEIYNKLTAIFAGKEYSGSSADNSVFSVEPYASMNSSDYYIEFTSTVAGTAYYYYTNTATVPTETEFDTQYRLATGVNGAIRVEANKAVSAKTYSITTLKDYKYVVLVLQSGTKKYSPIIFSNSVTTSDGFSIVPTFVAASNSITFKAAHAGTVSYYYTTSGATLTRNDFAAGFKAADASMKGSLTVTATSSSTIALNSAITAKNEFVALQIVGTDGTQYVPVVISVGDTGFKVLPTVKTSGVISYTPDVVGKIYYYYSKTDTVPSSSTFLANYASATYHETANVIAGTAATITYKQAYASAYPYMIIALASSDGVKVPVCVPLDYNSGYTVVPRMINDKTIGFKTAVAGSVKYYFTASALVPSIEEFNTIYQVLGTAATYEYKGAVPSADAKITLPEGVNPNMYAVLMMIDSQGNAYAPIVLSLKYSAEAVSITGFLFDPYIKEGNLYVTPVSDGTVRYYYAAAKQNISPTEFYTNYPKAEFRGETAVKAGEEVAIPINPSARLKYQAIMVTFFDGTNYSEPSSLFAFEDSTSPVNKNGFVFTVVNDVIVVTPSFTGTIYYKTTDSTSDFPNGTVNITGYSTVPVVATKSAAIPTEGKKYAIVLLKTSTTTLDAVVIDIQKGGSYSAPVYDDHATSVTTGLSGAITDEQNKIWKLQPTTNGNIFFTLVADGKVIGYMGSDKPGNAGSLTVEAGKVYEFDYSMIASYVDGIKSGYNSISIYAQVFALPATAYKSVTLKLK